MALLCFLVIGCKVGSESFGLKAELQSLNRGVLQTDFQSVSIDVIADAVSTQIKAQLINVTVYAFGEFGVFHHGNVTC